MFETYTSICWYIKCWYIKWDIRSLIQLTQITIIHPQYGWDVQLVCIYLRSNSLRPRGNRRHFADDIFKCSSLNENVLISIKVSLKFNPNGPINNVPTLVQLMAWRRPGDKPFSEPMMVCLLTHICVTRPQWVNYAKRNPCFSHRQMIYIYSHY